MENVVAVPILTTYRLPAISLTHECPHSKIALDLKNRVETTKAFDTIIYISSHAKYIN